MFTLAVVILILFVVYVMLRSKFWRDDVKCQDKQLDELEEKFRDSELFGKEM